MTPLELLFERADLPRLGLPSALSALYGGDLGIGSVRTYANFVASLDGVVGLPGPHESGHIVSGDSEPDRFVMGLLRACADAVVIGAGTFRRTPNALWRAPAIYPALSGAFAALRVQLGLRPHPLFVLVTASGELDTTRPVFQDALIATTYAGEAKLRSTLPAGARVVAFDPHTVPLAPLLDLVRAEGLGRVLTEGGPTLVGEMTKADLLDELFLTSSPVLFGRSAGDGKLSLIEGVALDGLALELTSVRRHGSHLFLRYARAK